MGEEADSAASYRKEDAVASAGRESHPKSAIPVNMDCDQSAQELAHYNSNDEMEDSEATDANEDMSESDAASHEQELEDDCNLLLVQPPNSTNRCIKSKDSAMNDDHDAGNCTHGVCENASMTQNSDFYQNTTPN